MKITLSRDEVVEIVKKHYNLTDFILEISEEQSNKLSSKDILLQEAEIVENARRAAADIESEKQRSIEEFNKYFGNKDNEENIEIEPDTQLDQPDTMIDTTSKMSEKSNSKAGPDYFQYKLKIEDFINSNEEIRDIELQPNLSLSGLVARYRKACSMYGFKDKVAFSFSNTHGNEYLKIVRKERKLSEEQLG